ncbi:MAG: hypothetical protein ACSLEN_10980 [Candidatus Malihini olakiniferum]
MQLHYLRAAASIGGGYTTDMGLKPGAISIVDPQRIAEDVLMNIHSLLLIFMIDALQEFIPKVILIGIHLAVVAFYCSFN